MTNATRNDSNLVGQILDDKYRVERVVGRGGMGVVLAAERLGLGHQVAIKLLHTEAKDTAVRRFVREARAAVQIKSEHIARVMGASQLPTGEPYLVTELLEGEDLSRLVQRRGPLPVDETLRYVLQACTTLAEAHKLGIVHRGIKPGNLFLTRRVDGSPCIKVLDFGISKLQPVDSRADSGGAETLTDTNAILGSPRYMSPEQLLSTGNLDLRTDIWSLGAVMHKLLSAAPPFDGRSRMQLCMSILQDPPVNLRSLRPELNPELAAIVDRCLAKEAEDRFQNVAEFARALEPLSPDDAKAYVEPITRIVESPINAVSEADQPGPTHQAGTLTNPAAELRKQPLTPNRRWIWGLSLTIVGVIAAAAIIVALFTR